MKLARFPAMALAIAAALVSSVQAMPFFVQADTTEITGVLIYSRTGPADNFDIVTAPGTRSEGTTRLYFEGDFDMDLIRLVEKMMIYAVEPQPVRSTDYPGVARVKVTGRTEASDDGYKFFIAEVAVAEEPGDGSDAQKMKQFIQDFTTMQKGMISGSGDPKAVESLRYLEEAGLMESVIKLGAQIAKETFR